MGAAGNSGAEFPAQRHQGIQYLRVIKYKITFVNSIFLMISRRLIKSHTRNCALGPTLHFPSGCIITTSVRRGGDLELGGETMNEGMDG